MSFSAMTSYDDNDKVVGKAKHKVVSKASTGDNMECEIHIECFDNKDKLLSSNDHKAYCKDGKFEFDMKKMMDNEELSKYGGMDVTANADFIEIPGNPFVDESLEDGRMTVKNGP